MPGLIIRDDLAVMSADGSLAPRPGQQQAIAFHDPKDPLVIARRFVPLSQKPVQKRCDPPVAIGGAFFDERADQRQDRRIASLCIGATRLCDLGLPPRKWSFMKYGFWTIGGREHAEQEA